jgi:hypothetical protein
MSAKPLFLRANEIRVESFSPDDMPAAIGGEDTTVPCKPGPTIKLGSTCLFSPLPCV